MPNPERSTATTTPVLDGPQWRALLEARWQARLTELTELSLAYHTAAEAIVDAWVDDAAQREAQRLLRRAVAARRKLEDVEEALGQAGGRPVRPVRAVRIGDLGRAARPHPRGAVLPPL